MDVFRTPDERFQGLPGYDFDPHYADVDGLRLHYVDEGSGRPIICFHGEPTWAYLYRKMLRPLVEAGHRVICPDMAGFGRSDKPTDRGWYTFERHSELIGELLAGLDLRDAIVVVQDWGGPVGLTWAVENEDRVAAPGDPQHRPLHRACVEGIHGLARLRREEPGSPHRIRDPGRYGQRTT